MSTRVAVRVAVLLASLPVLTTCDRGTGPPPAGWLALTLTSPTIDAGVLLTITGGPVDSARTNRPHLVSRRVGDNVFRLVVGGVVSNGVIAEIWVPDVRQAAAYSVVVVEAAELTTFVQRAVTGHNVQITTP